MQKSDEMDFDMVFRRNPADQVADTLDEFHKIGEGLSARLHLLGNSMVAFERERARLETLEQNRRQRNETRKLDKDFASNIEDYSKFTENANKSLDKTWKKLERSFDKFLSSLSSKRKRDVDAVRMLLDPAKDQQHTMVELISSMSDLKSTILDINVNHKDLRNALRKFDKAQGQLIDRLRTGDAIFSTYIADSAEFLLK